MHKTKDRLKEEIGLHKLLMTMTSAVMVSLVSWMCNNFIFSIKLLLALSGILVSMVAISFFTLKIIKKIGELDYAD